MSQNPTVFIVDDNAAFSESLSALISSMGLRTQCFNSAEEYLSAFDSQAPGCLIVDVRMPGLSGLDLQEQLRRKPLRPPIIVLTGHAEIPIALRAIRQGAVEFLQKTFTESELWDAIQRAIAEDTASRQSYADRAAKLALLDQLTPGEKDVLHLVLAGSSNKSVAATLKVSPRTVEDRRARIMQKLGVETLAELVRLSIELGISESA